MSHKFFWTVAAVSAIAAGVGCCCGQPRAFMGCGGGACCAPVTSCAEPCCGEPACAGNCATEMPAPICDACGNANDCCTCQPCAWPSLASLFQCAGCTGKVYWSAWFCDPPDPCDPCDNCGLWGGASSGCSTCGGGGNANGGYAGGPHLATEPRLEPTPATADNGGEKSVLRN